MDIYANVLYTILSCENQILKQEIYKNMKLVRKVLEHKTFYELNNKLVTKVDLLCIF